MGIAWGIVVFAFVARLFDHGLASWALKYSFFKFFKVLVWPVSAAVGMVLIGSGTMHFIYSTESVEIMLLSAAATGIISVVLYGIVVWRMMPEETLLIFQESRNLLQRFLTKNVKLSDNTT